MGFFSSVVDYATDAAAYGAAAAGDGETAKTANYGEVAGDLLKQVMSEEGMTVGQAAGDLVDIVATNKLIEAGVPETMAMALGDVAQTIAETAVDWIKNKLFGPDTADMPYAEAEAQAQAMENDGPGWGTALLAAGAAVAGLVAVNAYSDDDEKKKDANAITVEGQEVPLEAALVDAVPENMKGALAANDVEVGNAKVNAGVDFERATAAERGGVA